MEELASSTEIRQCTQRQEQTSALLLWGSIATVQANITLPSHLATASRLNSIMDSSCKAAYPARATPRSLPWTVYHRGTCTPCQVMALIGNNSTPQIRQVVAFHKVSQYRSIRHLPLAVITRKLGALRILIDLARASVMVASPTTMVTSAQARVVPLDNHLRTLCLGLRLGIDTAVHLVAMWIALHLHWPMIVYSMRRSIIA